MWLSDWLKILALSFSYRLKDHETSLQSDLHQVLLDYGLVQPDSVNYSELKFQDERLQNLWQKAVHDSI